MEVPSDFEVARRLQNEFDRELFEEKAAVVAEYEMAKKHRLLKPLHKNDKKPSVHTKPIKEPNNDHAVAKLLQEQFDKELTEQEPTSSGASSKRKESFIVLDSDKNGTRIRGQNSKIVPFDDHNLAVKLQEEYNRGRQGKESSTTESTNLIDGRDVSIIDPELEFKDPTPDIYRLFVMFNKKFFWNTLGGVEVRWSRKMTMCAGICYYRRSNRECLITLSLPLLTLRPRKDLVETLLHEMIHAYLFVTHNNKDRTGHGPEFQSHMKRINSVAGTNITIFHNFRAEVDHYKKHWWRCNGPCRKVRPFYGYVKRAVNRAPGPQDLWWDSHKAQCPGQFMKIREPEGYAKRGKAPAAEPTKNTLHRYWNSNTTATPAKQPKLDHGNRSGKVTDKGNEKKLVSNVATINNIASEKNGDMSSNVPKLVTPFTGTGHTLGKASVSINEKPWLKRLDPTQVKSQNDNTMKAATEGSTKPLPSNYGVKEANGKTAHTNVGNNCFVPCPVCFQNVAIRGINAHLDACIERDSKDTPLNTLKHKYCVVCSFVLEVSNKSGLCKICEASVTFSGDDDYSPSSNDSGNSNSPKNENILNTDDDNEIQIITEKLIIKCPQCSKSMPGWDLERHLESCNIHDIILVDDKQESQGASDIPKLNENHTAQIVGEGSFKHVNKHGKSHFKGKNTPNIKTPSYCNEVIVIDGSDSEMSVNNPVQCPCCFLEFDGRDIEVHVTECLQMDI